MPVHGSIFFSWLPINPLPLCLHHSGIDVDTKVCCLSGFSKERYGGERGRFFLGLCICLLMQH